MIATPIWTFTNISPPSGVGPKFFFFDMYHCLQATQTTKLFSNRFLNFRVMAKVDYKSKPYTTLNL